MKIAILVLALVAVAYAAPKSEEEVTDRLDKLQEDLSIMKQMIVEMDESEVATQAIEKVQRDLKAARAQIFIGRFSGWWWRIQQSNGWS